MGKFPKEWDMEELSELSYVQTGLAKGKTNIKKPVTLPYLRVANVQDGYLDLSQVKTIQVEETEVERYSLYPDDVLLTEGGDLDKLGRGYVWRGQIEPCLHQNHIFVVRTDRERLRPYFLAALIASPYGKKYFLSCAKRTTNLASINSTQLKEFPVLLPPIQEQDKLIRVIDSWDRGIDQTENLIAAKTKLKRGLMQQLLTGKKRFKEFEEQEWKEVSLSDVFERVTRKNDEGNANIVTISAQRGFVRQNDFFNKIVASETLDNYFLVERGEFCYNKSYSNGYPYGATKRLKDFDKAVVTTLYICFKLRDAARYSGDFFENFFEAGLLDKGLTKIAHEGGRAHGLLNVSSSDFFTLKITIPNHTEQIAIAKVFQAVDKEIELLQQQLDALKKQKRGLMQKLLTGQIRVKVDEQSKLEGAAV